MKANYPTTASPAPEFISSFAEAYHSDSHPRRRINYLLAWSIKYVLAAGWFGCIDFLFVFCLAKFAKQLLGFRYSFGSFRLLLPARV
jgi:hypothetical protein